MDIRAGIPTGRTPYHNLILTGFIGIGRTAIGRAISTRIGVPFVDLETEIQLRDGASVEELRRLYGEPHLRAAEDKLCQELALRRGAVIAVGGHTLLDGENRERLTRAGIVLALTCQLGEILRRLHVAQGARFHDPQFRAAAIYQVRIERKAMTLPEITTLDTTTLDTEAIAAAAIQFWYERETVLL
ncbi:MAG TPA: shikimate kinase [Aggregatilineales bacterium]|nr:hypothetical protein [Anaerolineales bacterium]HRE46483.1 shikimate kinase [Aggregatilineales bacterium]